MKKNDRKSQLGSDISEDDLNQEMFLKVQNAALQRELRRLKREISNTRKELNNFRERSSEMESLVSIIQRSWSQLEMGTALLLDEVGDSDDNTKYCEGFELLRVFLDAGSSCLVRDPVSQRCIPELVIDKWVSDELLTTEKSNALKRVHLTDGDGDFDREIMIKESLSFHSSFVLSTLEKLCLFISEIGQISQERIDYISRIQKLMTERSFLLDKIDKLSNVVADKLVENFHLERSLERNERCQDRDSEKNQDAKEGSTMNTPLNGLEENDLQKRVDLLEKQLWESEESRSKVEIALSERFGRPKLEVEGQISDMKNTYEEMRSQYKQRLTSIMTENHQLNELLVNKEMMITQLEKTIEERISSLKDQCQVELQRLRLENSQNRTENDGLKEKIQAFHQLENQLDNFLYLDKARKSEISRLQQREKTLISELRIFQDDITRARKREAELESSIMKLSFDQGQGANLESVFKEWSFHEERMRDCEQELTSLRASMNELILEIEAISSEDSKGKEELSNALNNLNESNKAYLTLKDEHLKMKNEFEGLKKSSMENEKKVSTFDLSWKRQDSMINQLKSAEQNARSEISTLRAEKSELICSKSSIEQDKLDLQHKLDWTNKELEQAEERNRKLQARCVELTTKAETERKQRLKAEQELRPGKRNGDGSGVGSSSGDNIPSSNNGMTANDREMLDITLGMLRCSVCHDRFKEVTIARCFHMFCRHCIDENLRNRHRKCPACGEKFGQDDVKTIYFTH